MATALRAFLDHIILITNDCDTGLSVDLRGRLADKISTAASMGRVSVEEHLKATPDPAGDLGKAAGRVSDPDAISLWSRHKKTASLLESGGFVSADGNQQVKLVAGVGFEPTTFRL